MPVLDGCRLIALILRADVDARRLRIIPLYPLGVHIFGSLQRNLSGCNRPQDGIGRFVWEQTAQGVFGVDTLLCPRYFNRRKQKKKDPLGLQRWQLLLLLLFLPKAQNQTN